MLTLPARQRECWFVSSSPDHHRSRVTENIHNTNILVTVISIIIWRVSVTRPPLRTFSAPDDIKYTQTHSRLKEWFGVNCRCVFICRGIHGGPFEYFRATVRVRPSAYSCPLHLTAAQRRRYRCDALRVRRPFKRKPPTPRFVTAKIVNFILSL